MGQCVAMGPGEAWAIAGYSDGVVAIWSLRDGAMTVLGRHDGAIHFVDVSRDGTLAATCGEDGKIKIWDVVARRERSSFGESGVTPSAVAFDKSGEFVATSGGDRAVRIWGVPDGRLRRRIESDDVAISVRFSIDGGKLAWGSGRSVIVANAETGEILQKKTGHTDLITRICFSPNGLEVASCGDDGTIRIEPITEGKSSVLRGHVREVSAIAYDPSGSRLASAGPDGSFRIWDVEHGREILNLSPFKDVLDTTPEIAAIRDLAFGADGNKIAVCAHGGSITILDGTRKSRGGVGGVDWATHEAARNEAAENWADARFSLTQLFEADPNNVRLRLRRGQANLHLRRWREADDDFSSVIKNGAADVNAYRGRARAELHLGRPAETVVDCDRTGQRGTSARSRLPEVSRELAPRPEGGRRTGVPRLIGAAGTNRPPS